MDAVVAIIAALIGGVLSAFGAWLAIGRQLSANREQQKRTATELFVFVLEQQLSTLDDLIAYRSANGGNINYLYLSAITSTQQLFERNREWLVWVAGRSVRKKILDATMHIAIWADQVKNAASAEDDANYRLSCLNSGEPVYLQVQQQVQQYRSNKDSLFTFAPTLQANLNDALKTLSEKRDV